MKTKLIFSVILAFSLAVLNGQVPDGINYQAVVRDGSGNIIVDEDVAIILSVIDVTSVVQWEERHEETTNAFGLISVVLGEGTYVSGSQTEFSDIPWGVGGFSLKTEVEYNSATIDMGTSSILSVPYALHAKTADYYSGVAYYDKLSIESNIADPEESLFEVKNADGQTIFAVYNEGVQIFVSDGDEKGIKGGFAVKGFGDAKDGETNLLVISPDSTRVYIGANEDKGIKGGFAVKGFGDAKGPPSDLLVVNTDSTRVYIGANEDKGIKGGFAVGSFVDQIGKGQGNEYFRVTRDSTRVYLTTDDAGNIRGGFAVETQQTDTVTGIVTNTEFFSVAKDTSKTTTLGFETKALGKYSTALGYGTIATQPYETVMGKFNDTTSYNYIDRLLTIGSGTSNLDRRNALVMLQDGTMGLGVSSENTWSMMEEYGMVIESNSIYITGPDEPMMEEPMKGSTYMWVDGDITASNLYLNGYTDPFTEEWYPPYLDLYEGTIYSSYIEADTVTARGYYSKGNSFKIADQTQTMGEYGTLYGIISAMMESGAYAYDFEWSDSYSEYPQGYQFGLFAQDLEDMFPNLVQTVDGTKMIDYDQVVAMLWQAVMEMADIIYGGPMLNK